MGKKLTLFHEYKVFISGKSNNTSLCTTLHIFKYGGGCIMLWVCLSSARTRQFFMIERNGIQLCTSKILEENLVQSAFQQTLGDKFTFQQQNNLKGKAKFTMELLTNMTLNIPEWPTYSFDLNQLENLWLDLKMVVE